MTLNTIKLPKQRYHQASETLNRAFYDDPLISFIVPRDKKRSRLSRWFGVAVRYGQLYGENYASKDITGVAVWIAPGLSSLNTFRLVNVGMLAVPFLFGVSSSRRLISTLTHQEKLHKKNMQQEEHWYLLLIGVDPAHQGRGIGSTLLWPILQQADRDNVACYLEATKQRNVGFYRRHGFNVLDHAQIPNGPPYWTMKRDPRQV
jgi:ribosomal protein S18 acetylase RimI-like enzyme